MPVPVPETRVIIAGVDVSNYVQSVTTVRNPGEPESAVLAFTVDRLSLGASLAGDRQVLTLRIAEGLID